MDTMDTLAYLIVSYRNGKIHGYVSEDWGGSGGFSWRQFMLATVYRSVDEAKKILNEPVFRLDGVDGPGAMIRASAGIGNANPTGGIDIRIHPIVLGDPVYTIQGDVSV